MPLDLIVVARIKAVIKDDHGKGETVRIVGKSLCTVQKIYQQ